MWDDAQRAAIDEALVPVREYLRMLLPQLEPLVDEEHGTSMSLTEIEITMPLEIDMVPNESGDVQIGMSPPLYYVQTSYETVGHQIRLKIVADNPIRTNDKL